MMSWSLKLSLQTSYFERIRNYFFTEGEMNYTGGAKLLRKLVAATICSILSFAVSYPFEMTRTLTHIDLTPVSKSQAATVGAPPPKGFAMGGFRKNMSAIKSSYGSFLTYSFRMDRLLQRVRGWCLNNSLPCTSISPML